MLVKYAESWKNERLSAGSNMNPKSNLPTAEVLTSGELLRRLGRKAEGINLLEVEKYLRSSKVRQILSELNARVCLSDNFCQIARKISGYCTRTMEKAAGEGACSFDA
jgi:chromosome transmission fidelity protein 1